LVTRKAIIFDIQRYAIHDGPGIRTLVFFKGCPLKCDWCSNPESQNKSAELALFEHLCIGCQYCFEKCPQGAISVNNEVLFTDRSKCGVCGACAEVCYSGARKIIGREMSVSEVFEQVKQDKCFYWRSNGGVTLGGGEVTAWAEFARDLLQKCRDDQIATAIETCGYAPWKKLEMLVPVTELFLYDLKTMDDEKHRKYTGVSNRRILGNLLRLSLLTDQIVVRVPVVPGINDSEKDIEEIARFVKKISVSMEVHLLPYHRLGQSKYDQTGRKYQFPDLNPPSDEKMSGLKGIVLSFDISCRIEN